MPLSVSAERIAVFAADQACQPDGGQALDGDDPVEPRVAGLVHFSHAVGADKRGDLFSAGQRS